MLVTGTVEELSDTVLVLVTGTVVELEDTVLVLVTGRVEELRDTVLMFATDTVQVVVAELDSSIPLVMIKGLMALN